jgi:hypothetical protein
MEEIYNLIGEILEIVQYIEWNIVVLACRECDEDSDELWGEMQTMTLGQVIKKAQQIEVFDEDNIEELEYILNKRNYLVHRYFKDQDFVKHKWNEPFLDNKRKELFNMLIRFKKFNDMLNEEI